MIKKVIAIIALVLVVTLSVAGCTSPAASPTPSASSVPTATPTAQAVQATASPAAEASSSPQASNSGLDPLLVALLPKLKAEYASADLMNAAIAPKDASTSLDELSFYGILPNGHTITAGFKNYGSVADATKYYQTVVSGHRDNTTPDPASATHFGQDAVTAALGHAPSLVADSSLRVNGEGTQFNFEVIQYDNLVAIVTNYWPD